MSANTFENLRGDRRHRPDIARFPFALPVGNADKVYPACFVGLHISLHRVDQVSIADVAEFLRIVIQGTHHKRKKVFAPLIAIANTVEQNGPHRVIFSVLQYQQFGHSSGVKRPRLQNSEVVWVVLFHFL